VSLLIDTAIAADSIVKAAWARAAANRERLRLRQDLQTSREATDRRLRRQPGWEDAFTNPLITNYRPDEPVAFPAGQAAVTVTIGRSYVFSDRESDDAGDAGLTYIWSGNGQERVTTTGDRLGTRVLPIGGDRMIQLTQYSPTEFGADPGIRCFFVNTNTVREVSVPSGITNESISALGDKFNEQFGWAYTQAGPREDAAIIDTPAVYLAFASLYPSLHPAPDTVLPAYDFMRPIVDTIRPGLREIVILTNDDEDPNINDGAFTSEVSPVGYEWTGSDPPPGIFAPVPLDQAPWRPINVQGPAPSQIPIIPSLPTEYSIIDRMKYFSWDWNLPSYCRSQLLALGFSTGDLEP
jgi:hypothetical protein